MKRFRFVTAENAHLILGSEVVPDRIRRIDIELRSDKDMIAEFVLDDGQSVPIGKGAVIEYHGRPPEGFKSVDVRVRVGQSLAYICDFVGPRKVWERNDPVSAVVEEQIPMRPSARDALRDFIIATGKADPELIDDVLQDIADDEELVFEDDDDMNFGPGHVEQAPVKPEEKARAGGAPSPKSGGPPASDDKREVEDAIDDVERQAKDSEPGKEPGRASKGSDEGAEGAGARGGASQGASRAGRRSNPAEAG